MAAHLQLVSDRGHGCQRREVIHRPVADPPDAPPLPDLAGLYPVAVAFVMIGCAMIVFGSAWLEWSRWR